MGLWARRWALGGLLTAVALVAGLTLPALAGAGAGRATLRTFAGYWSGHTRQLTISRRGLAREHINDGCCTSVIDFRFKLSHVRGTARKAMAIARITYVRVHAPTYFSARFPAPRVGQKLRVRLRNGVITDPLGTTFCNEKAGMAGKCGA